MEAPCSAETYGDFQCFALRYTPENKTSDHQQLRLHRQWNMFFSDSVTLLNYFVYITGSYIIEWQNDNEWWIWEHTEWSWPVLSHYTCIRIAGLRNTTKPIRTAVVATEIRTWNLADKKQDGETLHRDDTGTTWYSEQKCPQSTRGLKPGKR
jgi:hypothetical protein